VKTLQATIVELNKRLMALEGVSTNNTRGEENQAQESQDGGGDDDDFDLFGSDEVNH